MMGFLVGLLFGAAMSGSGSPGGTAGVAGSIPLRCYLALELGDQEYFQCRMPSMMGELNGPTSPGAGNVGQCWLAWQGNRQYLWADTLKSACDIRWHIELEGKALRKLNEAAKAAQR